MHKNIHNLINSIIFHYVSRVKHSVTIFNYHQVSSVYNPDIHNRDTWTQLEKFKNSIIRLMRYYEFIPLPKALEILHNGRIDKNYAVLTFDDGDSSLLEILPVLESFSIPCTLFINSAYLDDAKYSWVDAKIYNQTRQNETPDDVKHAISILRNTCNPVEYQKEMRLAEKYHNGKQLNLCKYLTTEQLFSINSSLVTIGLHGAEHQRFGMMSKDWNKMNIDSNLEIVSKHPSFIPVIAFPFGKPADWDIDVATYAMSKGLRIVLHDGGVNFHDAAMLNRVPSDNRIFTTAFLGRNLYC